MSDSLSVTQTGLQGVETAMQAVSDNLANSNTTGFKDETAEFATLLGEFVNGGALGGGIEQNGIARDFSQGSVVQSNSPTDLAIQGDGFFVLQESSGSVDYARNGHMVVGNDGSLLAFNGAKVMGYSVDAAGNPGGVLAPIVIPQTMLAPTASAKASITGNLDAGSPVISAPINPSDATTYNSSVSVQAFDSLGNSHVLTLFFQNAGPTTGNPPNEQWNWSATLDGSAAGLANNTGSFQFNSAGAIVAGGVPANPLTATVAGAAPLSLGLNFGQLTQFGAASSLTGIADGNAVGLPVGVQVGGNGLVSVSYSNGQTVKVAQVAIATFSSDQGLALGAGGTYQQTQASGVPTVATPGAGGAGVIRPSSLENSNVDTTGQLVSLVVLQRNFQANAKALQTEDNILGTLIQLQTT
jgi:flagellar hook protein FlgE